MERVIDNIYRIPVPLPGNPLKELNAYVIRGKDCSMLIDTGFRIEACRKALKAGLDDLGIHREETVVLLTHMHSDHSGLAPEFAGKDHPILVSGPDCELLKQYSDPGSEAVAGMGKMYTASGFPTAHVKNIAESNPSIALAPAETGTYETIEDGQILEFGGHRLLAILVPGHTPGQMCFYMEKEGIMFTGDHVLFDITPNITAWGGVEDSLGNYLDSLDAIRSFDVSLALPGHRRSGVMKDRIDTLKEHHMRRLEEVLHIVRTYPGDTAYHVASRMTWKIRANSWESFPVTQKWFAVGECNAHLDYLRAHGQIRRLKDEDGIFHYYI